MKIGCFKILFLLLTYFLCFIGCTSVKPANTGIMELEDYGPTKEYFITTMTLYDEMGQPYLQSVEINEKNAFIELVRQILDNPDYIYSYAQNDLYYIAQIYNHFSVAEFTARDGSTFEQINSTGTQATYRNTFTGQLMDIRTQLSEGRLGEFEKYYLDAGYFVAVETMDRSQLILVKNFRDISHLATEIRIDDLLFYSSDNEAFWGIMDELIGLNIESFTDQSIYDYLEPRLFAEEKLIGDYFKQYYSQELYVGEVVVITYIYKGNQRAMSFVYKPHHDVFTDTSLSLYDFVQALGRPSTWKYLSTEPEKPVTQVAQNNNTVTEQPPPQQVPSSPPQSSPTNRPSQPSSSSSSRQPKVLDHIEFGYNYVPELPFGFTIGKNFLYGSINFGVGGTAGVGGTSFSLFNVGGQWLVEGQYLVTEWVVGLSFPLFNFLWVPIGIGANHSGPEGNMEHKFVMEIGIQPVIFDFLYFSATYRLIEFLKSGFSIGVGFVF